MHRFETSVKDTTIYNKQGQIAQVVRSVKFTTDIFWNSLEPEKSLRGGPAENEELRWYRTRTTRSCSCTSQVR